MSVPALLFTLTACLLAATLLAAPLLLLALALRQYRWFYAPTRLPGGPVPLRSARSLRAR